MRQGSQKYADGEAFFISFSKIGKKYKAACAKAVKDHNLTPNEIEILMFLSKQKNKDTAKEIVEYLGISKSLVCRSAESLEEKGYIRSTKDQQDRRISHLSLEPAAEEIVKQIQRGAKEFFKATFGSITEEEKTTLEKILVKVDDSLW